MDSNAKIIIVDDHELFREGMKILIEMQGLGTVIAEAENGEEFLELLEKHNPDLVLMDIKMPVMGGLEACEKAIANKPDLKILALTMFCEKASYNAMLKAGAMGYLPKTSGKDELEKAIKTIMGGKTYFSKKNMRK